MAFMPFCATNSLPYVGRIMRLTSILLLSAALHVSATGLSQKVTLSLDNVPVQKVFAEVFRQTGISIVYTEAMFKDFSPVTVNVKDATVQDVLNFCLKNQPFTFSLEGSMIVIKKTGSSEISPLNTSPPSEIHGRVTDSLGNPLSGASISVKGTKRGTISDANGSFTLKTVSDNQTLIISFTGYTSQQYVVQGSSDFKIFLKKSNSPLDAVVVIPYGTTTQRLSTGDISTVTAKTIEQQPVSNVLAAMEGQVAGLQIVQTSGLPGGSFSVQIRGQNSIINGTNPFYVIDGVPYNSVMPTANGLGLTNAALNNGNPLNFINPNDIESVEVLKDADATAIYGSRAANGALLITTKRGKAGRMTVNLNFKTGITGPAHDIPLMNTQQYLTMRKEAFVNDGATPDPNFDYDLTFWDSTRYTNWAKTFLYTHPVYTDAEASVSGGTANLQYLVGGGYINQTSGMPTMLDGAGGDKKASAHFNLNAQSPDSRFKFSFSGSYLSDNNTIQSVDLGYYRFQVAPNGPAIYNPDGTLNWDPIVPGQVGTWNNPYSSLLYYYRMLTSNLVGSSTLSYMILPGLQLKADLGYTSTVTTETQTIPAGSYDPGYNITSGNATYTTFNTHSWIVEPQINYNVHLGKGVLTALAGTTFHQNDQSGQNLNGYGYISDALLQNIMAASGVSTQSSSSEYKYNAFFGRITYNWQDKYILNLNARRDGSSRFGPGEQFGNFGSVGAAWIFSKEKFVQQLIPGMSFGKLRASYGTTGNDQIGDYQYLNLFSVTNYALPYQSNQGLYPTSLFNKGLAWEIDKKFEAGMELGFIDDRILIQGSYYQNRSGNQLVSEGVSLVTGFNRLPANLPAVIQNSGVELVLHTINIKTKNFNWSSSINVSIPRNKLVSFPTLATSSYAKTFKIGQPINAFPVYHMVGVSDSSGMYQFADSKGVPVNLPNAQTDLTQWVNTAPKFFGGFDNTFSYKGFSLNIFFQFVSQTGRNIFGLLNNPPGTNNLNMPTAFLNRWQKPGDNARFGKYTQTEADTYLNFLYAQQSDFAYSDASFIRLKNLAFSWQLPLSWRTKAHLQNAQIYVQGQNLLTITHYFGVDPETQSLNSPPKKVLTFGIQVSL